MYRFDEADMVGGVKMFHSMTFSIPQSYLKLYNS